MIIKYINTKYNYLQINDKIKNEFSYIYEDKYLNDSVYVINSNLIRQSFVRKKHLKPWWFVNKFKHISTYKLFVNKWNIFNIYPLSYTKTVYNKRLLEEKKFYFFYKKFLRVKKYTELDFTFLKKNYIRLIQWRRKQRFYRIISFYKIFKQVKKFWKRGFFATYNGHIFIINRRFIRLRKGYVFFRGSLKYYYKNYLKMIRIIFHIMKNYSKEKYSYNKIILYYSYLIHLSIIIKLEFYKLRKAKLNKRGPFYSYFMFRKRPLRIINLFLRYTFKSIFNLKLKNNYNKIINNKLLLYYYVYNNPAHKEDYKDFFYLYYKHLYKLLNLSINKNKLYKSNEFIGDLWKFKKSKFLENKGISKSKIWKKYRKFRNEKRFIFRRAPTWVKIRQFVEQNRKDRQQKNKKVY